MYLKTENKAYLKSDFGTNNGFKQLVTEMNKAKAGFCC